MLKRSAAVLPLMLTPPSRWSAPPRPRSRGRRSSKRSRVFPPIRSPPLLRVYRISPDFKTKFRSFSIGHHQFGTGTITVESFISLRDPLHKINFPIVADGVTYPGTAIPVDPDIRAKRLLTGGDFDIESMHMAHDGTLWFGEEFGPFLKIFAVNLDEVDADGFLIKREVADLLHISDPANIAGFGPVFRFPFQTIESVITIGNRSPGRRLTA